MRLSGRHSTTLCTTSSSTSGNTWQWKSGFYFRLRSTLYDPKIGQGSRRGGAIGKIRCSTSLLKKDVSPSESVFCSGSGKTGPPIRKRKTDIRIGHYMDFGYSQKVLDLQAKLRSFMASLVSRP